MTEENLKKFIDLKRKTKGMINVNPLQTGGLLTNEAKKALIEWGDGYSVCDFCSGDLEKIKTPPIYDFVAQALPNFIGADVVTITNGARDGKFIVFHALGNPGDTIIIDQNAHYTTYVAAERAGLKVKEVTNSGYPEFKINVDDYRKTIEENNENNIALLLLTWPDGNYGNLADAKKLAEISKEYKIPLIINAAYAIGRMPVNLKEIGADFIIASGQKSMASSGPIGFIGMKKEWEDVVLKKSQRFRQKSIETLGCTVRGASMMTLMASFAEVSERVKKWPAEVEKARWFSEEMEKLGIKQLGEKPHNHDLLFFESEELFEISKKHKEGSFFLYKEMSKNNIWGIKPGLTKRFKISTFEVSKEDLKKVLQVFESILKKS